MPASVRGGRGDRICPGREANAAAEKLIIDRIIVLRNGRIIEHGDVAAVINRPTDSYTAELLEKHEVLMPATETPERAVLVIVVDGLRTQDTSKMLYLTTLSTTGVWYTNARTTVPSLTRPAAASLTTGHHPVDVGIAGNSLWESGSLINTGDPEQLEIIRRSWHGRLLHPAPVTISAGSGARNLLEAGISVAAVGTGSNGCSLLLNPEAPSGLGLVIGTQPHGSSHLFVAPPRYSTT